MIRKERSWNLIAVALLVLVSVFIYTSHGVMAGHPRPPHPGPHPGPHPSGPLPAVVLGPPAPWKAMGPPPAGKIWFHHGGNWIAVPPPPGDGPYLWDGSV